MELLKIKCHGIEGHLISAYEKTKSDGSFLFPTEISEGYTVTMLDRNEKQITFECVNSFEIIDQFTRAQNERAFELIDY